MDTYEALAIAAEYGCEEEVYYLIEHGYSPVAALAEWDLL